MKVDTDLIHSKISPDPITILSVIIHYIQNIKWEKKKEKRKEARHAFGEAEKSGDHLLIYTFEDDERV